ncbi:MAG: HAD-IG family 5'-nucleotidase [Myxococcota bacterium]
MNTYERPPRSSLERTPFSRRIFCNRTLNMRSIKAIGYDMDYTLVHYNVDAWEGRAYAYIKLKLLERGWPVDHLEFDPTLSARGLVADLDKGNLIKINNFGYVKRAAHGVHVLEYREMRRTYSRTIVDLEEPRYRFLNTLFAISEACIYMQLVDMFDAELLDEPATYAELYWQVRNSLDLAHLEGQLTAGITEDPQTYVHLDPDMPLALLDQREAGKKLLLITNSEWEYTRFMMEYCFDRFLPGEMTWRDLFDISVVSARKPVFFTERNPFYKVEEDHEVEGYTLLKPVVGRLEPGAVYHNGSASRLEEYLGCGGDEILYVGDHIFTDVNISKSIMRWRTALILRELEEEAAVILNNQELQAKIDALMEHKIHLENVFSHIRLDMQRIHAGYGDHSERDPQDIKLELERRRAELVAIDQQVAPLVDKDGHSLNPNWGYLMRTGKDKSMLTTQVERYADIYTSRVSNFRAYTPFMYFRSARTLMPHDMIDSRDGMGTGDDS